MDCSPLQLTMMETFQRFRRVNQLLSFEDVSRVELLALEMLHDHLARNGPKRAMKVSSLAEKLSMSPPAMSRLLRALEKNALIGRTVDPEDRRNTRVTLTEKGDRVRLSSKERLHAVLDKVIAEIGPEDIATLLRVWQRIVDIIETETKNAGKGDTACSESSST